MNCRFCKKPMLPVMDIPIDSDTNTYDDLWECHSCPNTVRSYPGDDWYAILAFYNGYWYEFGVFYTDTTKEPPFISISKFSTYLSKENKPVVKFELIKELDIDPSYHLTPQNVHSKLATILTFS